MRRTIAAAGVLLGMVAATTSHAAEAFSFDGKRRTTTTYRGNLSRPTVNSTNPTVPSRASCTEQVSCDVKELRLTLPKGAQWGKLRAWVTFPKQLNGAVYVYNSAGDEIAHRAATEEEPATMANADPSYELMVEDNRVPAGRYYLVVYDQGGLGEFEAVFSWIAHPPSRPRVRR